MFKISASSKPSRTKRVALLAFRAVRRVQHAALSAPVVMQTVAKDVAQAWQESARPNA